MKHAYLLAALLGLGALLPAAAQQGPAPLAARPAPLTHADSLAVLHQLFRHERRGGRIVALLDGAVLPLSIVSLSSNQTTDFQRGTQLFTTGLLGAGLVNGIVRWARFSGRRERAAVARFEQRQPQPVYLQRSFALALIKRAN